MTIVTIVAFWTLLSIPFGMFVGKVLRYCDCADRDRK